MSGATIEASARISERAIARWAAKPSAPLDSGAYENDESFTVTLSDASANAAIGDGVATGTILDNEAAATLSKRTLTGRIRMGITEDMTSSGLAKILARFARVFPDVSVRTHVAQSLVLQRELEDGTIDLGVMQVLATDVRPDDIVLFDHRLCWAKARDFNIPDDGPIPFLAYNDQCFYKGWLLEQASSIGREFRTVLECASNAGIIAGIEAGLGVSIVNERHVSASMDVIETGLLTPPDIAYIVRISPKTMSNAVNALAQEIAKEAIDGASLKVA